jgi:hypothetical protein
MAIDILYFDYWTRGVRHFIPIDLAIKSNGLKSMLIHLGSQRGELPSQDNHISGIHCRDLSFYGSDFLSMLEYERPKVVVLLNSLTEDKIIVRYCRNLGIKTIYMMHGLLVPQENMNQLAITVNSTFSLFDRLKRVPKFFNLFKHYLRAAMQGGMSEVFDMEIYIYFIRHGLSPGGNFAGKWKYRDSCADLALVYSDEDRQLFSSSYGYNEKNIVVVGNCSLDDLYVSYSKKITCTDNQSSGKYVVYVEGGLSDPKYSLPGWTEDRIADEVISLANISRDLGYRFILKLHPSSDYSKLLERVDDQPNITSVLNCDLTELILDSDLVMGQSSTVLMMALAINKPVFILDIPPLELKITTYADRKVGRLIQNYEQFQSNLMSLSSGRLQSIDPSDVLARFIGPFDGNANKRISDILVSFASK